MRYDEGPSMTAFYELLEFAETESLVKASERLKLSVPALSRKLKQFKSNLATGGDPILVKDGKNLRLTERGRRLLPAVRELARRHSQLSACMARETRAPEAVRLGVGRFATQFYCPPTLADLHDAADRFSIDVRVIRGRERILQTAAGEIDLAIVSHDRRDIDDVLRSQGAGAAALAVEPLVRHPFCVLAPRQSPIAKTMEKNGASRKVAWSLLDGQTLVGLDEESGLRRRVESLMNDRQATVRFASGTGAGGWPAAKAYARYGLGLAIVPSATIEDDDRREFAIGTLDDRLEVVDYVIHRNQPLTEAQNAVKEALVRTAKELAARLRAAPPSGKRRRR
jgi:DNA-binding transcriptional LysR family regulator